MQDDLVAQIVRHADGDPAAIAAQVEDEAERRGRTDVAPSLLPEAKAALLRAYDEMRELNSSYLGPEHVLLALARDTESDAGRLLARFGLSHTALRGAVIRGVTRTDEGGRPASRPRCGGSARLTRPPPRGSRSSLPGSPHTLVRGGRP